MIELNKENVSIGEFSVPVFSQAYCETDIIVPDVNPDISKILQVSPTVGIVNKSCNNNKINIEANADIVILYLGDDGNIYSMTANKPFSHTISSEGINDGMYIEAEISVDNTDYTVLNSRKVNVKVLTGIDANASSDVSANICTGFSSDENYEVLNKTVYPYKTVARACEQILVKERLDIPSGKPSIAKILRMDVCIRDKSSILTTNKMMIQATLNVSAVYLSDIDGQINTVEYEVPLTEVLALENAEDGMQASLKLCINKLFYSPEQDADGDNRYIMMECMIVANAKACIGYSMNAVQDAYCVKHPVHIKRESTKINRLVAENTVQISSKDVVVMPSDMPEIKQIFNISPHAFLGTAKTEGSKAIIEGVIESDIMYLSTEEECPITTHKHQQQFSYTMDLQQAGEDMVCDVQVDIAHSSFTISLGREIDLRYVLELNISVISNESIEYITDISYDENSCYEPSKSYCIKVYFVKDGDSLWSIAKKYRISKESLMEINNITADSEIFNGKQIMIPIN